MKNTLIFIISFLFCWACTSKKEEESNVETNKVDTVKVIKKELPVLEKSLQDQGLVNVQEVDSTIVVDLKYASTDNFFGKNVYGELRNAYLQQEVAEKLKLVNTALKKDSSNLRLLIYDAARPLSVQHVLWNSLDTIPPGYRKNYVADPAVGSIHNYGCAVDLTIIDVSTNLALDMGTNYDFFGYLAYPRKEAEMLSSGQLSSGQINNRKLLRRVMQGQRFMPITSEWWHFNYLSRAKAKARYKIIK